MKKNANHRKTKKYKFLVHSKGLYEGLGFNFFPKLLPRTGITSPLLKIPQEYSLI